MRRVFGVSLASALVLVDSGCNNVRVVQVVAGDEHTCALRSNGRVYCWGLNDSGQLGDGTRTTRHSPVEVLGLQDVTFIAAGAAHTCAISTGGVTHCWGANWSGQIGDGTTEDRLEPALVEGVTAKTIACGEGHTCAIVGAGDVVCWGANENGQTGGSGAYVTRPGLAILHGASQVVTTHEGSCALVAGGEIRCWGRTDALGQNAPSDSAVPVPILDYPQCAPCGNATPPHITGATAIYGGSPCAVLSDGTVECWDDIPPQVIPGVRSPEMIASNVPLPSSASPSGAVGEHCGVVDGEVQCWMWPTSSIASGPAVAEVAAITASQACLGCGDHACVLAGGTIHCWGSNAHGQLGDGTTTDSMAPVKVVGLE